MIVQENSLQTKLNLSNTKLYYRIMDKIICIVLISLVTTLGYSQNRIEGTYNADSRLFETTDTTYHIDFFEGGVSRIYQSGYIGLMDSTGTILIKPKYDQIFDFEGDVAKVTIRKQNGLIDRSGKELVAPFDGQIEAFINGFAKCKIDYIDSRIINTKGEFINEFTYGFLGPLNEGRFTYIRGRNFGLLTTKGEEIVIIQDYDDKSFGGLVQYFHLAASLVVDRTDYGSLFEFNDGRAVTFAKVDDAIKFGCINVNGEIVVPITFDRIEPFENGFAAVKRANAWGVIDTDGNIILPCSYESVQTINGNRFIVSNKNMHGVVDGNGEMLIPMNYASISSIPKDKYIVSKDDQYGVINEKNETILSIKYPILIHLFDQLLITNNDKKWGVINSSGKTILPFKHDGVVRLTDSSGIASLYGSSYSLNTGVPRYAYQGEYFHFDKNGRINKKTKPFSKTITMVGDFHNADQLIAQGPGLFVPYINSDSPSVNESTLDGYDFSQNLKGGFKIVGTLDENVSSIPISPYQSSSISYKKGIINSKGEIVVPIIYNDINIDQTVGSSSYFGITQSAPQNLFIVKLGAHQGVINIKNEVVIPLEYDEIELYPGIIFLFNKTMILGNNGEIEDEFYESGIADMNGRIIAPLKEQNYSGLSLEIWFDDELRTPNR